MGAIWCAAAAGQNDPQPDREKQREQRRLDEFELLRSEPLFIDELDDPDARNDFAEFATEEVELSEVLLRLVEQLDSGDFRRREDATDRLLAYDPSVAQLRAMLASETLTLEQRHRLLTAARVKLLKTPRGAIGIRMRWWQDQAGKPGEMEVLQLLPDLPAQNVLRVTDRIIKVDGQDLLKQDDLLRYAQTRTPGEKIMLTVRRIVRDENGNALRDEMGLMRYETIEVDLVLGSADKLIDPDGLPQRESPVMQDRRQAARRFARAYGIEPRRLELDPDTVIARGPDAPEPPFAVMEPSVDQHRYVVAITRELSQLEEGLLEIEGLHRVWRNRILNLRRMIAEEPLTPRDRKYLSEVLERCMQLIGERQKAHLSEDEPQP